MKVLVQRVSRAAVRVDGETVASIGPGLLVLIGVERSDGPDRADAYADKTVHLRIFPDRDGRMNRSVLDVGGAALVVSQFTLAGSTLRGRRPSWDGAAEPATAEPLYLRYVERLRGHGLDVQTGVFRAMMEVESVNDGPVTLMLDPPPPGTGGGT